MVFVSMAAVKSVRGNNVVLCQDPLYCCEPERIGKRLEAMNNKIIFKYAPALLTQVDCTYLAVDNITYPLLGSLPYHSPAP